MTRPRQTIKDTDARPARTDVLGNARYTTVLIKYCRRTDHSQR